MIIGICGKKRSGKDTVGDYFLFKYGFKKQSFAGVLKRAVKDLFHLSEEDFSGDKETILPIWGVSLRKILQFLGTDILRDQINPDFHVIRTFMEVNPEENIIFTDVRFINESLEIKKRGGIIIKISRETGIIDTHSSELEIDLIFADYVVENCGTLEELYSKIEEIYKEISIKNGSI